jgi:hypothetical protein
MSAPSTPPKDGLLHENDILADLIAGLKDQIRDLETQSVDWLPAYLAISPAAQQLEHEFTAKLTHLRARSERTIAFARRCKGKAPK